MAVAIFRHPRTRQPTTAVRVNRGSPLTRGLVFAAYPLAGTAYDAVSGRWAKWSTASASRMKTMPSRGISVWESNNAAAGTHLEWLVYSTQFDRLSGARFSLFCEGRSTSTTGIQTAFGTGNPATGDGIAMAFDLDNNQTNGALINSYLELAFPNTWDMLGTGSTLRLHRFMITVDGTNARFFSFGKLWETKASTCTIIASTGRQSALHAKYDELGATGGDASAIALALAWNRTLSLSEYQRLYQNPWQVFAQLPRRWVRGVGAADDLVPLIASGLPRARAARMRM